MRIASKINVLTILLSALICGNLNQPVLAADVAVSPPAAPPAPALTPPATSSASTAATAATPAPSAPAQVASSGQPIASSAPAAPAIAPPSLPLPVSSKPPAGDPNNLTNLENKVPDSVKEIVKHLDNTTEEVTLDDLNSARQAVAKIEALIEIEKHLAELDKVREDREKKSPFTGAIPASALTPPMPSSILPSGGSMRPVMSERPTEVARIMGRNGHYSAVLKMPDDKTKTVQAGDSLPDGSKVLQITSTEVDLMRGKFHETLHVKNVETVFGNS